MNQIAERTHKTLFEFQHLRQLAKDLHVQVKSLFCFFFYIVYNIAPLKMNLFIMYTIFFRLLILKALSAHSMNKATC